MGEEKLKAVFAHTLGIVADARAYGVAKTWDSIAHMALIASIRHHRLLTATLVESGMAMA